MSSLPTLLVKTAHSEYLIDQEEGVVTRRPVHPDANDLSRIGLQGKPKPYTEILSELVPGGRAMIVYPDGTWSVSTEIQSVEKVPSAVPPGPKAAS